MGQECHAGAVLQILQSVSSTYLTLREVAELLKLSEKTIYRLVQQGKIPAFKVGGSWRFRSSDIEAWIEGQVGGKLGTTEQSGPSQIPE